MEKLQKLEDVQQTQHIQHHHSKKYNFIQREFILEVFSGIIIIREQMRN